MPPIRVLVVDDSAVVRHIITSVVDDQPDMEVVGTAADGAEAVEAVRRLGPDVVTLDVEMPHVDGIDALREMRRQRLDAPVIMFSTQTTTGAQATVEALALGAADVVAKPSGVADLNAAVAGIRHELLPRVRALGRPEPVRTVPTVPRRPTTSAAPVELVCIGISTGGPKALHELLVRLPVDLRTPVLIVQHMPPMFTTLLAERLDQVSPLPVEEATAGTALTAGTVWLAPGGRHMTIRRAVAGPMVDLTDTPPENGCRPAVDVLFRTAAAVYGPGVLAVVMTGLGRDGTEGARAVRQAGGAVLAQDQASSTVWGMPGSVVEAGLADALVSLDDLPTELVGRTGAGPCLASTQRSNRVRPR